MRAVALLLPFVAAGRPRTSRRQAMQPVGRLGEEARAGRDPAPLDCSHMNSNGARLLTASSARQAALDLNQSVHRIVVHGFEDLSQAH
jgi:hypothetical protein